MHHDLRVFDDAAAVASEGAAFILGAAMAGGASGRFQLAVSGGRTPWVTFAELTRLDVPWVMMTFWQVDERLAPWGDPDRNLTHLDQVFGGVPADVRAMPVDEPDPDAGAERYAASLPAEFDLIHLGLGTNGHTASLLPGDPVLEVTDRLVAVTGTEYQGRRRMTLTYPALARTRQLLWLVTGEDKRAALQQLLAGDTSIPAGRVEAPASVILADRAAAG